MSGDDSKKNKRKFKKYVCVGGASCTVIGNIVLNLLGKGVPFWKIWSFFNSYPIVIIVIVIVICVAYVRAIQIREEHKTERCKYNNEELKEENQKLRAENEQLRERCNESGNNNSRRKAPKNKSRKS